MLRRSSLVGVGALLLLALAACTGSGPGATHSVAGPARPTASHSTPSHSAVAAPSPRATSAPPTSPPPTPAQLQHVVVIMEENKPASSVIGNPDAPFVNALAQAGAQAQQYSAVAHPSLPNYLALTSGTTAGITSDCNPPGGTCLDTGPNLAQELDSTGHSWRMYAESMPGPCATANTSRYAVKHNPFLYFPSVTNDAAYCAWHDVPYDRFAPDLATTASLPDFSFISPDRCNDMHDCSIATGDGWLQANVPPILASPAFTAQRSLLVITFDEGDSSDNVVACILAGPAARPHAVSAQPFTHYSLLRTIELEWGLPPLTANDAGAPPMTALLQ